MVVQGLHGASIIRQTFIRYSHPAPLPTYVLCILRGAKISYSFEYIQKYPIVVAPFSMTKKFETSGNSSEGRKSYFDRKEGQIFYVI